MGTPVPPLVEMRAIRVAFGGVTAVDSVTVDLGPDPEAETLLGERAVLIGFQGSERITAEEVARRLDTINYEITCGLTPRVARAYHRDGTPRDG